MENYKVSIVNYLNSVPFVLGLNAAKHLGLTLSLDYPAEGARKLHSAEVDIALAPVATLLTLDASIISEYCIGCDGAVGTVKLFSEVPIGAIQRIYLDYQSETSVRLTRILCRHYWNIQPELVQAYPGYQKEINGTDAGLIIGDRAIRVLGKYGFETDLGAEWKAWTGLPFVFAAWMARKPVDADWLHSFNSALKSGLEQRPEIIEKYRHLNTDHFSVDKYLFDNIDYRLTEKKKAALEKFLEAARALENP